MEIRLTKDIEFTLNVQVCHCSKAFENSINGFKVVTSANQLD